MKDPDHQRRAICAGLAVTPLLAALGSNARAQTSRRAFTLVIPYPPGGATDIFGRFYAEALGAVIGEKIVVENRAGANGAIGLAQVANSLPDGRTLAYTYGNLALAQFHSMKSSPLNVLRDLVPVIRTVVTQGIIVTSPDSPFKDLSEFIAQARRSPGTLTYADYGELTIGALIRAAGIELVRVPYRGGVPGMVDVMGGQVNIIASSAAQVLPNLRAGKLKALAISSEHPIPEFPNVRTVRELLPNYQTLNYQGVFAPKGTPRAIVDELYERSFTALSKPEVRKSFSDRYATVSTMRPDELRAFMEADSANIAAVLKAAGIVPE